MLRVWGFRAQTQHSVFTCTNRVLWTHLCERRNGIPWSLNWISPKIRRSTRWREAWIVFVQHAEPTGAKPFSRLLHAVLVIMGYKVDVEPPSSSYCNHLMGFDLLPLPAFSVNTSTLLLYISPFHVSMWRCRGHPQCSRRNQMEQPLSQFGLFISIHFYPCWRVEHMSMFISRYSSRINREWETGISVLFSLSITNRLWDPGDKIDVEPSRQHRD